MNNDLLDRVENAASMLIELIEPNVINQLLETEWDMTMVFDYAKTRKTGPVGIRTYKQSLPIINIDKIMVEHTFIAKNIFGVRPFIETVVRTDSAIHLSIKTVLTNAKDPTKLKHYWGFRENNKNVYGPGQVEKILHRIESALAFLKLQKTT